MRRMSNCVLALVLVVLDCAAALASNPVPSITTLSPPSVYAGSATFTLTVNGSGFISSTVIYWDPFDPPLATTFVNGTQVTAVVPASFVSGTTTAYVYASNPAPGGGQSQSVTFSVLALDPSLNSVSPAAVVAGSPATTVVVSGYNFMVGASVLLNNQKVSTTYVSNTQLQVQIPKSRLLKPEIVQLAVQNPAPGGLSQGMNFNVTYPAKVVTLNLPANDIVWDPKAQLIYASLPSSYGSHGNSIATINPSTGKVTAYHFVGSEPTLLALSADSSFLYVALSGNGSVQRMILPSFALDINDNLGTNGYGQLNTAQALQVSPGDAHTFAVSVGSQYNPVALEFFTDTSLLPNMITYPVPSFIQFASSSVLYGNQNGTLLEIAVDSNGGTLTTQWNGVLGGSNAGIIYNSGLIYSDSGQVFNPATGEPMGSYDVNGSCCSYSDSLLPKSANNATFVVGQTPFFSSLGITRYNLSQFTPLAVINLSQFVGGPSSPLISWGTDGLAFVINSNQCCNNELQTVLVQSPGVQAPGGKK